MNSTVTGQPTLRVNPNTSHHGPVSVSLSCPDPEFGALLAGAPRPADLLKSVFRVSVAQVPSAESHRLPGVSGRYVSLEDEIQFVPTFPFESGVKYRATFDPSSIESYPPEEPVTLDFTIPPENEAAEPAVVTQVFPTCDVLPENLLRFYVHFSRSMQRGQALKQIALLVSDGQPVSDALYRPPVELWDRTMRRLTVLLDPGRLKRWVGPNAALGPPLKAGQQYILEVGSGMLDQYGRVLGEPFRKQFLAGDSVREPIAVKDWQLQRPKVGSRQPVALTCSHPLDRALAFEAIRIKSEDGSAIGGQIEVDQCETRWSLTPASAWTAGVYRVRVRSQLEDVCGNTPTGAFDRSLRTSPDPTSKPERISFAFRLV
jgi:hypothetical protein